MGEGLKTAEVAYREMERLISHCLVAYIRQKCSLGAFIVSRNGLHKISRKKKLRQLVSDAETVQLICTTSKLALTKWYDRFIFVTLFL